MNIMDSKHIKGEKYQPQCNVNTSEILHIPDGTSIVLGKNIIIEDDKKIKITQDGILKVKKLKNPNTPQDLRYHLSVQPTKGKRYIPQINDLIIATVQDKGSTCYQLDINSYRNAYLSIQGFNRATKNNRPQFNLYDIVYCRVIGTNKYAETEVTCLVPEVTTDWSSKECYLRKQDNGIVFSISIPIYQTLIHNPAIINTLRKYIEFDIIISDNYIVWIYSDMSQKLIILQNIIIRCIVIPLEQLEKMVETAVNRLIDIKPIKNTIK